MPIYLDRLGEIAKRLTPAVGQEAIDDVARELLYAVILENDRPEMLLLGGTRLWFARVTCAAVAAQFSSIIPFAGGTMAGMLSVLEGIEVEAAAGSINMFYQPSPLAAGYTSFATAIPRDSRARGKCSTQFFQRQGTQVATNSLTLVSGTVINRPDRGFPVVLVNGSLPTNQVLTFESSVVNQAFTLTAWGYERPADAHEIDATVV